MSENMHKFGCNGLCIIGLVIAIIFGGLFMWFLVQGYLLQAGGAAMATAFGYYLFALIMIVIAKYAKMWSHTCGTAGIPAIKGKIGKK